MLEIKRPLGYYGTFYRTQIVEQSSNRLPELAELPLRLLDGIFSTAEEAVLLAKIAKTIAIKYPTGTALVGVGVASFLAWMAIGDPIKDHLPFVKSPQVTLINSGGNILTPETGQLPIKDVLVTSLINKPVEKFDYSGWKILPGPGFSLRYPQDWRATSSDIVLGPDGGEEVRIKATAQALKGQSFTEFVASQYAAYRQYIPSIVTSPQPANFPGWEEAGLDGRVISYQTILRPGGALYEVKDSMAYINGMVYQFITSQEVSQIPKNDSKVNLTLDSLVVAGTSTGIPQSK